MLRTSSIVVVAACAVTAWTLSLAEGANGTCSTGCNEYSHEKVPGASSGLCSAWKPMSQARDGSIDYAPNADPAKHKVADGANTTRWYNQCEECEMRCPPVGNPSTPPSYGLSEAAPFVFDDEECQRIWEPQQRNKCVPIE